MGTSHSSVDSHVSAKPCRFFCPVSRQACCIGTLLQLLIFITLLKRKDADRQVFKHLVASNRKIKKWLGGQTRTTT